MALSPLYNSYDLFESNNERRLIVRCGMTITKYHVSKLFDLIPNMEECSPLSVNTSNERKFLGDNGIEGFIHKIGAEC